MTSIFTNIGVLAKNFTLNIQKGSDFYEKIRMYLVTDRPKSKSLISYNRNSMRLYSENIGAMYGFITGNEPVQGGSVTMLGDITDKGVIKGDLYVKDINIIDVPESTRILKVFSIVGVLDALKSKKIEFKSIRGGFTLRDGRYTTENISAIGKNIAVSAKGYVDFYNKNLELKGMILPSYKLGNFLGNIPFFGTLISGVDGQGPLTQNYTATGEFDSYKVSVDNSGILTIGLLRNIFSSLLNKKNVPVIFTEDDLKGN